MKGIKEFGIVSECLRSRRASCLRSKQSLNLKVFSATGLSVMAQSNED